MWMGFGGFQGLDKTNPLVSRTIGRFGSLLCRVLEPDVDRIHADRLRQLVDHALNGKCGHRRAGCPICGLSRAIGHNIEPVGLQVLDVVAGKCRHCPHIYRRPWKGTALILQFSLAGSDATVFGNTDLHANCTGGCRPRSAEHFFAAHHHLHWTVGLA